MAAKKKKQKYESILTPPFTLVEFQGSLIKPNDKGKYELKTLWQKDTDLKELKQAILAVVKAEQPEIYEAVLEGFKSDWPRMRQTYSGFGQPFRDGNEKKAKYPFYANTVYISARTNYKPKIWSRKKGPDGKWLPYENPEEIYTGMIARARLEPNAYPSVEGGLPGFNFFLQSVQILEPGTRLFTGGAEAAADSYDDLPENAPADNTDDL